MFKFLLFGIFIWQRSLCEASSKSHSDAEDTDIPRPILLRKNASNSGCTDKQLKESTNIDDSSSFFANATRRALSNEYLVTKGIGAHKLHFRKLPWNHARKICINEGGQLADIRSDSEEKILLRLLFEENIEYAWVGFHDMFTEGDWVSVLGDPLGKWGWDRWWKGVLPNPDNFGGDENCACLMRDGGGMNDYNCNKNLPFICKIVLNNM